MGQGVSNTGEAGKVNGGSEQLYAYMQFMATMVYTPERIICKALNEVIKINFPNTDLKIGFNREEVKSMANTNPADRPINQKTQG
jgi:hypothetical protein